MKKKILFYVVSAAVAGVFLLIIWDTFKQPGVQDLNGDFKRVAFYKNENNEGPVQRIYAVTLGDTLWREMKLYGDYMPHTKYGNTKVYFFLSSEPAPDRFEPTGENFDPKYKKYCLARYEKDAMGQVSFIKDPFRNNTAHFSSPDIEIGK